MTGAKESTHIYFSLKLIFKHLLHDHYGKQQVHLIFFVMEISLCWNETVIM